jgi:hypothetical protein
MERLTVKGSSEHVSNLLSVSPDENYSRRDGTSAYFFENLSQALLVDLIALTMELPDRICSVRAKQRKAPLAHERCSVIAGKRMGGRLHSFR